MWCADKEKKRNMSQAVTAARSPRGREDDFEEVENFHGVYLLCSTNPKYKGWTYIGYTVDPNRRIVQHNKGRKHGGAFRTSNRGPWDMVLIVHGFPNDVSALRFEWAWQHPKRSRRLRCIIPVKKSRMTKFQWLIELLGRMLCVDPWCRLPLTLRWLMPKYKTPFTGEWIPPSHIQYVDGLVKSRRIRDVLENSTHSASGNGSSCCLVCGEDVASVADQLRCFGCYNKFHLRCLADLFLRRSGEVTDGIVPVSGTCPTCDLQVMWGDLVRFKKGCFRDVFRDPSVPHQLSQP
ncbi:unnamed protein product [Notodromas monacha]|uniref:Structure-specific endonuclease subunit SLX1 homolog n=1 Tax=Notodromas monacha TaxID=399045 RepID=A0A7R9GI94_9CRUS|nr:unnamed protein product [Notodromas monacha]CAG0921544.1 unnamed protein product [Notodromas monacha]